MGNRKKTQSRMESGNIISVGDIHGNGIGIGENISIMISMDSIENQDMPQKAELMDLVRQLNEVLKQLPASKSDDAKAVAETAQTLLNKATEETPNKTMIQITGDALKQAAQNIADVAPTILHIASQIVTTIAMLINR